MWCVVEYIRHLEVRRGTRLTRLTRVVLVFGCGLKRGLVVLVRVVGLVFPFLCCTLLSSCSVSAGICVQSGRVEMEYGGGDNYVLQ